MNSFQTNYPKLACTVRSLGVIIPVTLVGLTASQLGWLLLEYYTIWGAILTGVLFALILLKNVSDNIEAVARFLTPIVVINNFVITVGFWCLVYPYLYNEVTVFEGFLLHGIPLILTTTEWTLNHVTGRIRHIMFSICLFSVYFLLVNMPIALTVGEVYPNMNYKNAYTYLSIWICIMLFYFFGFGTILLKNRLMKKREKKLLDYGIEL